MKITANSVPSLSYELEVDGETVDKASSEEPLKFIFGQGQLIPEFETNIEGKVPGDVFDFIIKAENGYGEFNDQAIVDLPMSTFEVDGKVDDKMIQVGATLPMQDQEGNPLHGIIKEVNETTVKMDFNHPLAGKDLHFSGKVEEVREATSEELTQGNIAR